MGIELRPELDNPDFVAQAIGNLAAFDLAQQRKERLDWQVVRIAGSRAHHYHLIVRHPDRILDPGFAEGLESMLQDLSRETVEELRRRLAEAERVGLRLVPLRHARENVDFWQDDFWNFIGGPSGIGTPGSFP